MAVEVRVPANQLFKAENILMNILDKYSYEHFRKKNIVMNINKLVNA